MLPKTSSPGQYSVARRTLLSMGCVLIVATAACTPVSAGPSTARSGPPFGGTLRVVMPGFAFSDLANPEPKLDALDPQISPWYDAGELFRCCLLRTLVGYTGLGRVNGADVSDWLRRQLRGESRSLDVQPVISDLIQSRTEDGHPCLNAVEPTMQGLDGPIV